MPPISRCGRPGLRRAVMRSMGLSLFEAIPNGKPLHTFPGIALFGCRPHIEIRHRIDDRRIAAVGLPARLCADFPSKLVAAMNGMSDGAGSQRVANAIDA